MPKTALNFRAKIITLATLIITYTMGENDGKMNERMKNGMKKDKEVK